MERRYQPLDKSTIHQGFRWIRQHAAAQADRFALLYLAMGWTWEDAAGPPSPLEVRSTILRMVDELAGDLIRAGDTEKFPYAMIAASSGGLEVGVERVGISGKPKAFIRFVAGDLGELDDGADDQTER